MQEEKKVKMELTEAEVALLNKARQDEAKRQAELKKKADTDAYKALVDKAINETVSEALELSQLMSTKKEGIIDRFKTVINLKEDIFKGEKLKDGRYSDSFTNGDSTARISIGYNTNDAYDDTYTAGVDLVHEYIESLASDDKSRQLADMVNTLLAERSKSGQLKAQNVLRLEQMANESGDDKFIEGMKIIRDAYKPEKTRIFIRVEVKGENNEWKNISLNMTNC